ncbi:hypothetical protein LUZ60_011462 [Juncus effusus]|nr:hypothetical protein LUZ60_011462 [Juncus effusus]
MESHTLKLVLCLLLFVFSQGNACNISSIEIQQVNIGNNPNELDTIFEVMVKNTCICSVANVIGNAPGFKSSMEVDPNLFRQQGNGYLVNDGKPIASQSSVTFQYKWSHTFEMSPLSFKQTGLC